MDTQSDVKVDHVALYLPLTLKEDHLVAINQFMDKTIAAHSVWQGYSFEFVRTQEADIQVQSGRPAQDNQLLVVDLNMVANEVQIIEDFC